MAPRKKVTLSMSGGGFIAIYHIGVASCFREMEEHFEVDKIAGASAGAIAAACYLCRCCLGEAASDVLKIAQMARSSPVGPLSPRFRVVNALRNGLERILPDDAHLICSGRLSVSLTRCRDGGNKIVSHFESKAELIQALICSSFIPFYSGLVPPYFHDGRYWDGGMTNNMPVFDPFTITISPFSGESDICPSDDFGLSFMEMNFANQSFRLNSNNAFRLSRALFPPHPDVLREICEEGYIDALRFIKKTLLCEMVKGPSRLPFTPVTEAGTVDTSPPTPDQLPSSAFPSTSQPVLETNEGKENGHTDEKEARASVESGELMTGDHIHRSHSLDQIMQILNRSSTTHNLPTPVMDALKEASASAQHPALRALSFVAIPWVLPLEIVYSTCVRLIELTPRPVTMDVQHYLDIFSRVAQNVADGLIRSHSKDGAWLQQQYQCHVDGKKLLVGLNSFGEDSNGCLLHGSANITPKHQLSFAVTLVEEPSNAPDVVPSQAGSLHKATETAILTASVRCLDPNDITSVPSFPAEDDALDVSVSAECNDIIQQFETEIADYFKAKLAFEASAPAGEFRGS